MYTQIYLGTKISDQKFCDVTKFLMWNFNVLFKLKQNWSCVSINILEYF